MDLAPYYPPSGIYADSYKKDMRIIKTKTQWIMFVAFLLLIFTIPQIPGINSPYFLRLLIGSGITVTVCLGLNILTGYCGQLNIGQAAFVMTGAFTSALLNSHLGWSFWVCIIPAGFAAAIFGVIFGAPSVRIEGIYLALTTLAAQIILTWIALYHVPGAMTGMAVEPIKIGSIVFDTPEKFYYIAMLFAIMMTFFAKNLMRSGVGRAFVAIRDNDKAAEAMGIDIFRYKLLAFIICTFYAGVAGSLYAHFETWIYIEAFTIQDSVWYIVMIIVGGLASIEGTILGVVFITAIRELVFVVGPMAEGMLPFLPLGSGSGLLLFVIGGVAVLFLVFEPRGLAHRWCVIKAFYRLWPFGY